MNPVAGVDIGAGTAKAVILAERKIISYSVRPTGGDSVDAAEKTLEEALQKAGLVFKDLKQIISTGYSRNIVQFAHKTMTEITCHARGANYLVPEARTVIDIGCQDSKAIRINDRGMVTNFLMNDKCAAGTGRFIEVIAQALGLKIEEVGPTALISKNHCEISSTCTVFAETEIVAQRAQGRNREDLIAGALKAIAKRVGIMAIGIGVMEKVVFTGGVAKNIGVKKALDETLGIDLIIPVEPQIVGALGAAIFADDELE
ncbi:MAG: 2-hydroxyglutaryl-CoA dehydratase [Dehalococcoidales bacterium]|nr:2-hydroxyglutaryl-CoA dehydratase [Dehalococcoidales bacterium]